MPAIEHPHISEERLRSLPSKPGVYLMKDGAGEVIYVGKAKALRTRIRSYFNFSDNRASVKFIVKKVVSIETLITEDERQALILEADLINRYRPRYNIQLKDDRSHLMVRVDMSHQWPRLELVRERREDAAQYIGPFAFSHEVRGLLDIVNRTLPLRTCSDKVIFNRVRPCLEYQIKRCAAPCCLNVEREDYSQWLKQAIRILEGKSSEVISSLEKDMELASEQLRFEDAARLRDRIEILKRSWVERPSSGYSGAATDAIGIYREEDKAEVSVLRVRGGKLEEPRSFSIVDAVVPDDELLASFLGSYYRHPEDLPEEILLPMMCEDLELREEIFSELKGAKVVFNLPQRGYKSRLLRLALSNATERFNVSSSGQPEKIQALEELRDKLGLDQLPRTIECIDISHFQGGQTVGSVVLFRDGKPDKEGYRRFQLLEQSTPDDFASMKEVVRRHLSRAVEENTLPDLIVIDGGKGQLSSAVEARNEVSGSNPQMIGLAKKRNIELPYRFIEAPGKKRRAVKPERVFREGETAPVVLPPESNALNILERIRDEAHRSAITFHRKKRAKAQFRSALDLVQGIGPKRRVELLREFGSVEAIRNASAKELVERANIPEKLAVKLLETLASSEKPEASE